MHGITAVYDVIHLQTGLAESGGQASCERRVVLNKENAHPFSFEKQAWPEAPSLLRSRSNP
jgi:hypothetical protein